MKRFLPNFDDFFLLILTFATLLKILQRIVYLLQPSDSSSKPAHIIKKVSYKNY
jgi:hypothetical protein